MKDTGNKRHLSFKSCDNDTKIKRKKYKKTAHGFQINENMRSLQGLTGLVNLGNTCYMNVVLQVLCHIKEFCDSICAMSFKYPEIPPKKHLSSSGRVTKYGLRGGSVLRSKELNNGEDTTVCNELHSAFNIIWSGLCPLYSPIGMRNAVVKHVTGFDGNDQHDAHEFLVILLTRVHEEMTNVHQIIPSAVDQCFQGSLTFQTDSRRCPFEPSTIRSEEFHEISVGFSRELIEKRRSILTSSSFSYDFYDMLDHFTRWESYQCNKCDIYCCRKRMCFKKFPRIFRIHINRFYWNTPSEKNTESGSCKINWHVEFPELMTLSEVSLTKVQRVRFKLCAVIVHDGLHFDRGHYKSYFYLDTEQCWIKSNDKEIAKVDVEEVLSSQAYVLFYRLIS